MKLSFALIGLFVAVSVSAAGKKNEHREHGAHEHGSGKLGLAFTLGEGKIDFKVPSESIFGFEHAAKNENEKKAQVAGLAKLEQKIGEMIEFSKPLKCQIKKESIEVVSESGDHGGHSDTVASFSVKCEKAIVDSKVIFNFQKFFPRIKDLDVDVIADTVQTSIEAKKTGTVLVIK